MQSSIKHGRHAHSAPNEERGGGGRGKEGEGDLQRTGVHFILLTAEKRHR